MNPTQRAILKLARTSTFIESGHTARSVNIKVACARHNLRQLCDAGHLSRFKVGRRWRYSVSSRYCPCCGRILD